MKWNLLCERFSPARTIASRNTSYIMRASMSDFFKMDFFFVVTTVIAIFVGAFFLVALFYLIKILKSVDHLAKNVSEESDNVRGDITVLRGKMRDEGMKLKHFVDFFTGIVARKQARKKPKE